MHCTWHRSPPRSLQASCCSLRWLDQALVGVSFGLREQFSGERTWAHPPPFPSWQPLPIIIKKDKVWVHGISKLIVTKKNLIWEKVLIMKRMAFAKRRNQKCLHKLTRRTNRLCLKMWGQELHFYKGTIPALLTYPLPFLETVFQGLARGGIAHALMTKLLFTALLFILQVLLKLLHLFFPLQLQVSCRFLLAQSTKYIRT